MSNHFHLLLEVPRMADGGLSDEELQKRLSGLYSAAIVAGVAAELVEARKSGHDARVAEIHARFAYRMHSLSEFMKGLLGALFHRRRGDRQQGVCERGVYQRTRAIRRKTPGWREEVAR